MKKAFAVLALAAMAAAGFYWWLHSPPHAVLAASQAIKQHDLQEFHHWVDVRSISQGAVDDLLAEPVHQIGAGMLERVVGFAIVSVFHEPAVDALSAQIDRWVTQPHRRHSAWLETMPAARAQSDDDDDDETAPRTLLGALGQLIKPPSIRDLLKDYGLTKNNFRGLGSCDIADHDAHVGLRFFSPRLQHEIEIKLELANASGNWRIIRIANMQEIISQLAGG